jgi:hypothetical protein
MAQNSIRKRRLSCTRLSALPPPLFDASFSHPDPIWARTSPPNSPPQWSPISTGAMSLDIQGGTTPSIYDGRCSPAVRSDNVGMAVGTGDAWGSRGETEQNCRRPPSPEIIKNSFDFFRYHTGCLPIYIMTIIQLLIIGRDIRIRWWALMNTGVLACN